MDEHSKERTDPPVLNVFGIHIPPEDAVALGLVMLEVAADAWARQRNRYLDEHARLSAQSGFAIAHEAGSGHSCATRASTRSRSARRLRSLSGGAMPWQII